MSRDKRAQVTVENVIFSDPEKQGLVRQSVGFQFFPNGTKIKSLFLSDLDRDAFTQFPRDEYQTERTAAIEAGKNEDEVNEELTECYLKKLQELLSLSREEAQQIIENYNQQISSFYYSLISRYAEKINPVAPGNFVIKSPGISNILFSKRENGDIALTFPSNIDFKTWVNSDEVKVGDLGEIAFTFIGRKTADGAYNFEFESAQSDDPKNSKKLLLQQVTLEEFKKFIYTRTEEYLKSNKAFDSKQKKNDYLEKLRSQFIKSTADDANKLLLEKLGEINTSESDLAKIMEFFDLLKSDSYSDSYALDQFNVKFEKMENLSYRLIDPIS